MDIFRVQVPKDPLEQVAERALGAPVSYEGFVPVRFRGEVAWEGVVSLFSSEKGRAYAWAVDGSKEPSFMAIPHRPPIDSPHAAVWAWIVREARKK